MKGTTLLCSILLCTAAACGDSSRDFAALRKSINEAKVKIGPMVSVAEASMPGGRVITAELRPGTQAFYAYGTVSETTMHDIHIDTLEGQIVLNAAGGTGSVACPGSISMTEALTIAEGKVTGGAVIAAIPDDDVACAREIQVLTSDKLWEVKVAADGSVLEVEVSDEGGDGDGEDAD